MTYRVLQSCFVVAVVLIHPWEKKKKAFLILIYFGGLDEWFSALAEETFYMQSFLRIACEFMCVELCV